MYNHFLVYLVSKPSLLKISRFVRVNITALLAFVRIKKVYRNFERKLVKSQAPGILIVSERGFLN